MVKSTIMINFRPRAWLDSILTYPRFLGTIKPHLMKSASEEMEIRLEMMGKSSWPKLLEAPLAQRILVISPHPDDETLGCGGFLLKHKNKAEIKIINLFNGENGGALEDSPWQNEHAYKQKLIEVRSQELDFAAQELGANEVVRCEISEGDPKINDSILEMIREKTREFQPQVVLIPWLFDRHSHHQMACSIFTKACKGMDFMTISYEIWGLLPMNGFMDVTDVSPAKKSILSNYKTQLKTVDYLSYVDGLEKTRAFMAPINKMRNGAVEAFFLLPSKDYFDLVTTKESNHHTF